VLPARKWKSRNKGRQACLADLMIMENNEQFAFAVTPDRLFLLK
jgi:hypothetical protein